MKEKLRIPFYGLLLLVGSLALWAQSGGQVVGASTSRSTFYGMNGGAALGTMAQGTAWGSFTPDGPIVLTRLEMQQLSSVVAMSGCSTPPVVSITDGTHMVSLTVPNSAQYAGVTASQTYAAGVTLTMVVSTAGVGCSGGNNLTFVAQFKPAGS